MRDYDSVGDPLHKVPQCSRAECIRRFTVLNCTPTDDVCDDVQTLFYALYCDSYNVILIISKLCYSKLCVE